MFMQFSRAIDPTKGLSLRLSFHAQIHVFLLSAFNYEAAATRHHNSEQLLCDSTRRRFVSLSTCTIRNVFCDL
jgi:hypothetical protein